LLAAILQVFGRKYEYGSAKIPMQVSATIPAAAAEDHRIPWPVLPAPRYSTQKALHVQTIPVLQRFE
jgi:hypothetical protein